MQYKRAKVQKTTPDIHWSWNVVRKHTTHIYMKFQHCTKPECVDYVLYGDFLENFKKNFGALTVQLSVFCISTIYRHFSPVAGCICPGCRIHMWWHFTGDDYFG